MVLKPRMMQKVKDHMSDSGIKDPVMQPLIDRLLVLGKDLQKADNNGICRSAQDVENILKTEVDTVRRLGYMNPLLDMEGACLFYCYIFNIDTVFTTLVQ
jgi:hypothetical protein